MDEPGLADGDYADPRWGYPEYPDGSVVEVRVHGVGGEPPSGMTRDPHPVLVRGDDKAGFHRARDPVVGRLSGAGDRRRTGAVHAREVLSWGGQTSGTVRHAFWVLLAPFALFNVAGRMHRATGVLRPRVHRAVCRVLALTMTLGTVGLVCGIAFDLVAVQCGADVACLGTGGEGRWPLAPLRRFEADVLGRLGVAAGLPTAVLFGLWAAGRYGATRLEGHTTDPRREAKKASEPTVLAEPDFWRNAWPTSRLRSLHATASLAWVGVALALSASAVGRPSSLLWDVPALVATVVVVCCLGLASSAALVGPGPRPGLHRVLAALRLLGLGALGIMAGTAALGRLPLALGPGNAPAPAPTGDVWWALGLTGGLGASLVAIWAWRAFPMRSVERPDVGVAGNAVLGAGAVLLGWVVARMLPEQVGGLEQLVAAPGWFDAPYRPLLALVVLQAVLLLLLAGAALAGRRPRRPDCGPLDAGNPVPGNLAAVAVAVLSLLLVAMVGAGLHALAIEWLGRRGDAPAAPIADEVGLVLPPVYGPLAVGGVLGALLAIALSWGAWRWMLRSGAPDVRTVADRLAEEYAEAGLAPAPDPDDEADAERLREVGGAWAIQRLVRAAGHLLAGAVLLTATGIAVALLVPPLAVLTTPAVWAASLLPVAGVALIRSALRDPEARRDVGRLWDVLTFWPRVTHPFAPPCYGEALVPMLEEHVRLLARGRDGKPAPGRRRCGVVVAGHSQGSVIALAAVARLPADLAPRVALVTYGSPIGILYERCFRATLQVPGGATLYEHVGERVRSWHHLFAMTEPFAYPFWPVPDGPGDAASVRRGWPENLAVPRARALGERCPACGSEDGLGRRIELLIRDPERWSLPDGSGTGVRGHSAYDRHPDVDAHLRLVARDLAGAPLER